MSPGGRFGWLSLTILCWSLARPAPGQNSPQTSEDHFQFRVSVDMVSLSVTVLDENRKLVTDLGQDSFSVFEDGVRQEIQVFSREALALRLMILLDTSSSMQMKLTLAQEAAVRFVRSLKPGDQVEVIEFNDRVLTLAPMTADFEEAIRAIQGTEADGATKLHEALYVSLKGLALRRKGSERPGIVLLSDGADTRSLVPFEDVLALARKTDVLIYPISLRATMEDLKKDKYFNAKYGLGKLADETGGSAFYPASIGDLARVYDRISTELKSQYNLGYLSTNPKADGSWRRIQVLCDRPGSQVRTRHGYYALRAAARGPSPRRVQP